MHASPAPLVPTRCERVRALGLQGQDELSDVLQARRTEDVRLQRAAQRLAREDTVTAMAAAGQGEVMHGG